MHAFFLLVLLTVFSAAFPAYNVSWPCQAVTRDGQIVGHVASNETGVCEYLGIPYAAPPIGDLRFAPPQKHNSSGRLFVADTYGADCPQSARTPYAYPGHTPQFQRIIDKFSNEENNHTTSEDCLTLNVWSKQGSGPINGTKPVIVFFYGGKFQVGTSNTPYWDGQFLADSQDVVVVTFNYRVNIFGFSGAPTGTQNVALYDHRMAVEWVRDHIAAFGGDASRIVLDGQSAGAFAVDNWAYAFKDDPIVSGLISQSGNVFSFGQTSANVAESNWYNVSAQLGCGSSGDTLPCMRTKNVTEILAAAAKIPAQSIDVGRSQPAFQGTVDHITIFGDYDVRSKTGEFARVPYLQGINNWEPGWYAIATAAAGTNVSVETWRSFELEDFTCTTAFQSFQRTRSGVPSYRYRYFGDWDNLRLYPGSGAYHGSDVEMVIGNSYGVSGIEPGATEKELTAWMQGAWAAFARDSENGLVTYGWPAYDRSKATLAVLGMNNSASPAFVLPSVYDLGCASLNVTS